MFETRQFLLQEIILHKGKRVEKDKLSSFKAGICEELDKRVADKILEMSNLELLKKLINHAESEEEALAILALGTTWKRTGFHFDKRLERQSSEISYLALNADLSFCAKSGGGGAKCLKCRI